MSEETKARLLQWMEDVKWLVKWNVEEYNSDESVYLLEELELLIKELNNDRS